MTLSLMSKIWLVWALIVFDFTRRNDSGILTTVDAAFVPFPSPSAQTYMHRSTFTSSSSATTATTTTSLWAAPQRLSENTDGVVYVNDRCINCAACSNFAPTVFGRSHDDVSHIVHTQPNYENAQELDEARAALAACPVAAIRVETEAQRHHNKLPSLTKEEVELASRMALSPKHNHLDLPFPRQFFHYENIFWVGHHNEASFGATPYLLRLKTGDWVMVDTPRYNKSSIDAVKSKTGKTGPKYLVLTHVDDTADHNKWVEHFPSLKRVFHSGDLGRHNWLGDTTLEDVEILLSTNDNSDADDHTSPTNTPLRAYTLDGTELAPDQVKDHAAVILHTPGHSPGSISMWCSDDGVLFTGDTYCYTTRTHTMSGMPRYGNNLKTQSKTLQKIVDQIPWRTIAPGHGHPRDYTNEADMEQTKQRELEDALKELQNHRKW